jgi:CheY-like chemotaxis protein
MSKKATAVPNAHLRVLVVDDHPDTLKLFEMFLAFAGFDVTAVGTAVEALAYLATAHVDVVATDLAMPGMDGFELIQRLRSAHAERPVPIVAITGQAIDPARVLPAQLGCCRLLLKPCDLGHLAQLLHSLVENCAHDCFGCGHRIPPVVEL